MGTVLVSRSPRGQSTCRPRLDKNRSHSLRHPPMIYEEFVSAAAWYRKDWMTALRRLLSLAFPTLSLVQRAAHGFGLGRPVRLDPMSTACFRSRQQTGYLKNVRI